MNFTLTKEYLKKGIEFAEINGSFKTLENIYKRIPKTKCKKCSKCCKENPGATFSEFLNFFRSFSKLPNNKELINNIVRTNLSGLVTNTKCSFLNKDLCTIYDKRPFSCRIFGLESEKAFNKNFIYTDLVNENLIRTFREVYNIKIIKKDKLNYCDNVTVIDKININDYDIENLNLRLSKLEFKFYKKGFPLNKEYLDSYEAYIIYLIAEELGFNYKSWGDLRIKVSKELQDNQLSTTLEEFIDKISNYNFKFLE